MAHTETWTAVERAARDSYGRLLAFLATRTGDVAAAEDALSEAFLAALQRWPVDGVPERPDAWLWRTARNRSVDASRRRQVRQVTGELWTQMTTMGDDRFEGPFPDDRLKLMFVCSHPALDPATCAPLMLQCVLGLDAARIASAFLVSPAAMSQRLVRAKARIRDVGIPFEVPEASEWEGRVASVLDALYAAYNSGADSVVEGAATQRSLAGEAIAMTRTLVQLLPEEAEARGLLALMLHCEARRAARQDSSGKFVPLDRQDPRHWSGGMIDEAERQLCAAAEKRRTGRYQLEAAIHSVHNARLNGEKPDWEEIALLYEGLVRQAPIFGAQVGRAVALAESGRLEAGWNALADLDPERMKSYQPYWAARGYLLKKLGRLAEAAEAFDRAGGLTDDPVLREYLAGQISRAP